MPAPEVRRIRLAYIDDKPTTIPAPELEVLYLRGLRSVQDWMIDPARPCVDVVVCDVNMAHREKDHPDDVVWGGEHALPAYGPILALPFLGADNICEFVPISSWWAQVEDDGYVLIPVALLLTAIARRPFGLRAAREWVKEQMSAKEWLGPEKAAASPTAKARGSTDPITAIGAGLKGLRGKLKQACEDGRLTIAGLDSTIQSLRLWNGGLPLEPDGAPTRVELVYPDRSEFIRLTSLFADIMSLREVPTRAEVARIVDELESWTQKDLCFRFPRSGGVYEQAARLLNNRLPKKKDREKSAKSGSNRLKDRAKAAGQASGIDPLLLIRTAIIFAFLRAWYFTRVLPGVYDDEEGSYELMDWTYWFLDIHPRRAPQNRFKRLLGIEVDDRIYIGEEWHQRPFKTSATKPFDPYAALKNNEELNLTPVEKALGRRFLEDADRFFPAGIKPVHRFLWRPHLEDEVMAYPRWLK